VRALHPGSVRVEINERLQERLDYWDRRQRAGRLARGQVHQGRQVHVGNSHDQVSFGRIAKIFVDPRTNEAYLADGYLNKRVAVIDGASGKLKRYWGAYGEKPDDANLGPYDPNAPPKRQFLNPVHCVMLSKDGLLYVCDRNGDRIQVFKPDGAFVKEAFIAKGTKASGSAWDVAFSPDPQQRFLYVTDGMNNRVHILRRDTLEELTTFGDGTRPPAWRSNEPSALPFISRQLSRIDDAAKHCAS
jgi:DNA-binding beta-propeller fold protein YncE